MAIIVKNEREPAMSLQLRSIGVVPEQTCRVARAAFPKGNPYIVLRNQLGSIFVNEDFADLYAIHGQPAWVPWRLALITLLQFKENLSDRQAADAVRGRIDWKYALSLELTDAGFDFSVLSEFRIRLLSKGAEARLFEIMLAGFQERDLLKARGKQRTDSTHILANVRELNRIEFVGETMRAALNELATVVPDWLKVWVHDDWFKRYGHPFSEYRLPQKEAERLELGEQIGRDGIDLLTRVYAEQPELGQLPQVEILRRVWVLQYYTDEDDQTRWRRKGNTPPGERILTSPHDTDARLSQKRGSQWIGYKVHLTETCDEDTPHISLPMSKPRLPPKLIAQWLNPFTLNWIEKIVFPNNIWLIMATDREPLLSAVMKIMRSICLVRRDLMSVGKPAPKAHTTYLISKLTLTLEP